MFKWTRKSGELSKSASFTEGEILTLLLGSNGTSEVEILNAAYESAKALGELRGKAFSVLATATVVAILAKFGVISSFGTSGVSVAEAAFKPIALTGYSISGLYFGYFHSRFRFFELWFESIYQKSSPSRRVDLLLRYPLAFDVFKLEPAVRGFPADMWPKRSQLWHLPAVMLLLIALIIYAILSFALWVSLSIDVWQEAFPNKLVAIIVVLSSVLTGILSGCLPLTGAKSRIYEHFGLTSLLTRLQSVNPARHQHFMRKIVQVVQHSPPN